MDLAHRMMPIQMELDSRKLDGSILLITFANIMLASTTCQKLLKQLCTNRTSTPAAPPHSQPWRYSKWTGHHNITTSAWIPPSRGYWHASRLRGVYYLHVRYECFKSWWSVLWHVSMRTLYYGMCFARGFGLLTFKSSTKAVGLVLSLRCQFD